MRGYTIGEIADSGYSPKPEGEAKIVHPVYVDDGCVISPRCLECPLIKCHHDFEGSGSGTSIKRAIEASWAAGISHPRLDEVYNGRPTLLPPSASGSVKQERVERILQMRSGGLALTTIAQRLSLSYSFVQRVAATYALAQPG